MRKSPSGFVYAALHPTNPNWVKIGVTRLTPWSRLNSLSRTSVREPFVLHDARFVWEAFKSERRAHVWLENNHIVRQKEFFELPKEHIGLLFDELEAHDRPQLVSPTLSSFDELEGYGKTFDDHDDLLNQQDMLEWHTSDLNARWKYIQNSAVHDLEKDAARGDPHSTFALAHYLANQGITPSTVRHCSVLAQAAEKQGLAEASLQGLQWETLVHPEAFPVYWERIWFWRGKREEQQALPDIVSSVFESEQHLLRHSSSRNSSWGSWCAERRL